MLPNKCFEITMRFLPGVIVCLCSTALVMASPESRKGGASASGIIWQIYGTWQVAGRVAPLKNGDFIKPESLLRSDISGGKHSITILLPDGQRILDECSTAEDCARGFRVPALTSRPGPFAIDMLTRIHAVLIRELHPSSSDTGEPEASRDEVATVLDPANRIQIAGLMTKLAFGHYVYALRAVNGQYPAQDRLPLEKTSPSVVLTLPGPGLFDMIVSDDQKTRRVDCFIVAVKPGQATLVNMFAGAQKLMSAWNSENAGWPTHDFLRAYLKSLGPIRP